MNITTGLYSAYHTGSLDVVASRDEAESIVLKGSGFGAIDGHGFETAGTITEIDIFVSGFQFVTITDLSLNAGDLATVFADADMAGFAGLLFGGNDHFVAGASGANFQGYGGNDRMRGLPSRTRSTAAMAGT